MINDEIKEPNRIRINYSRDIKMFIWELIYQTIVVLWPWILGYLILALVYDQVWWPWYSKRDQEKREYEFYKFKLAQREALPFRGERFNNTLEAEQEHLTKVLEDLKKKHPHIIEKIKKDPHVIEKIKKKRENREERIKKQRESL